MAGNTKTVTDASFAADVGSIVYQLQAACAQHIVVWNTPNLGLTPAVSAAGAAAFGSFLAGTMNGALATRLAGEAGVSIFDAYGFGTTLAQIARGGVSNDDWYLGFNISRKFF